MDSTNSWTPSPEKNKLGDAMKDADKGNFDPLMTLIRKEMTPF